MDIKSPWDKYEVLSGARCDLLSIQRSMSIIAQSKLPHQFRTTFVRPLLTDSDIETIRCGIPVGSTYRVQKFRSENAFDPALR
jgi:pyruvate formate lyase activating enzyme